MMGVIYSAAHFLCSLSHMDPMGCVLWSVAACADRSLQTKTFRVGDGNGEFVLELLPGSIRRQTDLIKAGVRDWQPGERKQRQINKS